MRDLSNISRRALLAGAGIIGIGSVGVGYGTYSLFTDRETTDIRVEGGTLDLAVGEENGGTVTVSLGEVGANDIVEKTVLLENVGSTTGWVDFNGISIVNDSEGQNPENESDTSGDGELDDFVSVMFALDRDGNTPANHEDMDLSTTDDQIVFLGNRPDEEAIQTPPLLRLQELDGSNGPNNTTHLYARFEIGDTTDAVYGDKVSYQIQLGLTQASPVVTVATDLIVPWGGDFAPDGTLFFTERIGRINRINGGSVETILDREQETVFQREWESGLMGLELHPDFPEQPYIYVAQTYKNDIDGDGTAENVTRILKLYYTGNSDTPFDQSRSSTIFDGIPAAQFHDGGRLLFGPDGHLYVTCGDAESGPDAQDRTNVRGTILRMDENGDALPDNPFYSDSPTGREHFVFTYGHRNAQGLAFHPTTGDLYSTEHGPAGDDEINLIEGGKNYGWPNVTGTANDPDYQDPLKVYGRVIRSQYVHPSVAPASADFYGGDLYFGALGKEHVRHVPFTESGPASSDPSDDQAFFQNRFGRIRTVIAGPDGLYFMTSNADGRATEPISPVSEGDAVDKIYRWDPTTG